MHTRGFAGGNRTRRERTQLGRLKAHCLYKQHSAWVLGGATASSGLMTQLRWWLPAVLRCYWMLQPADRPSFGAEAQSEQWLCTPAVASLRWLVLLSILFCNAHTYGGCGTCELRSAHVRHRRRLQRAGQAARFYLRVPHAPNHTNTARRRRAYVYRGSLQHRRMSAGHCRQRASLHANRLGLAGTSIRQNAMYVITSLYSSLGHAFLPLPGAQASLNGRLVYKVWHKLVLTRY